MTWHVLVVAIPLVVMIVLWAISTRLERTALSPAPLFLSVWLTMSVPAFIMTLVFDPSRLSASPYYLIFAFSALAWIGATLGLTIVPCDYQRRSLSDHQFAILRRLYRLSAALFIVEVVLSTWYYIRYFDPVSVLLLPATIAGARYVQDIREPALIASLHIFRLISPGIHGFICSDPERWRYLRAAYLWLAPIAVVGVVFASRSQVMFSLTFWAAGYITGAAYFGTARWFGIRRTLALSGAFAVCAVPFAFVVYAIRWGLAAPEQVLWQRAAMAVFGIPIVLGDWINGGGLDTLSQEFSLFSMNALSRTLGIRRDLTPGIYSESSSLVLAGEEAESNIFTAFRPLLDDLGVPGSLVFMAALALLAIEGWSCLKRGRLIGIPLVLAYNVWVIWSPITSAFSYNAVIAACALLAGSLAWSLRSRSPS